MEKVFKITFCSLFIDTVFFMGINITSYSFCLFKQFEVTFFKQCKERGVDEEQMPFIYGIVSVHFKF